MGIGAVSANGGVLDLAGNSPTIGSLGGLAGTITNSVTSAVTLNVNQSAVTSFSGTLQNGAGTLALVANGSGGSALADRNEHLLRRDDPFQRLARGDQPGQPRQCGGLRSISGYDGGRQRLLRDAKHRPDESQCDDPGRCRPDLYECRRHLRHGQSESYGPGHVRPRQQRQRKRRKRQRGHTPTRRPAYGGHHEHHRAGQLSGTGTATLGAA